MFDIDNLPQIPGEAFTAPAQIIEKVIDKFSDVIGWSVTPRGNKAYQIEAEEYLIEKIKGDSGMPELAKAACISKVRKIIKEYQKQNNICLKALRFLDSTADPDSVDDDWLTYFFEHAKNISKEEMAVIWSHVLAREINTPNHIPKSLLYILSVIDYEDAVAFRKLANISLQIGEGYYPIYFIDMPDIYKEIELKPNDVIRLQETNLIQYSKQTYDILLDPNDNITYFDKKIDIGSVGKICVGELILSKAGNALMSVITDKRKVDGFEQFVKETVIKTDYKIAKILSN